MRRITWQIVALAAVIGACGVGAVVAVAVYAPEYLVTLCASILAYAAGEGRARLGRPKPAEHTHDGTGVSDVVPYRGDRS